MTVVASSFPPKNSAFNYLLAVVTLTRERSVSCNPASTKLSDLYSLSSFEPKHKENNTQHKFNGLTGIFDHDNRPTHVPSHSPLPHDPSTHEIINNHSPNKSPHDQNDFLKFGVQNYQNSADSDHMQDAYQDNLLIEAKSSASLDMDNHSFFIDEKPNELSKTIKIQNGLTNFKQKLTLYIRDTRQPLSQIILSEKRHSLDEDCGDFDLKSNPIILDWHHSRPILILTIGIRLAIYDLELDSVAIKIFENPTLSVRWTPAHFLLPGTLAFTSTFCTRGLSYSSSLIMSNLKHESPYLENVELKIQLFAYGPLLSSPPSTGREIESLGDAIKLADYPCMNAYILFPTPIVGSPIPTPDITIVSVPLMNDSQSVKVDIFHVYIESIFFGGDPLLLSPPRSTILITHHRPALHRIETLQFAISSLAHSTKTDSINGYTLLAITPIGIESFFVMTSKSFSLECTRLPHIYFARICNTISVDSRDSTYRLLMFFAFENSGTLEEFVVSTGRASVVAGSIEKSPFSLNFCTKFNRKSQTSPLICLVWTEDDYYSVTKIPNGEFIDLNDNVETFCYELENLIDIFNQRLCFSSINDITAHLGLFEASSERARSLLHRIDSMSRQCSIDRETRFMLDSSTEPRLPLPTSQPTEISSLSQYPSDQLSLSNMNNSQYLNQTSLLMNLPDSQPRFSGLPEDQGEKSRHNLKAECAIRKLPVNLDFDAKKVKDNRPFKIKNHSDGDTFTPHHPSQDTTPPQRIISPRDPLRLCPDCGVTIRLHKCDGPNPENKSLYRDYWRNVCICGAARPLF